MGYYAMVTKTDISAGTWRAVTIGADMALTAQAHVGGVEWGALSAFRGATGDWCSNNKPGVSDVVVM